MTTYNIPHEEDDNEIGPEKIVPRPRNSSIYSIPTILTGPPIPSPHSRTAQRTPTGMEEDDGEENILPAPPTNYRHRTRSPMSDYY